MTDNKVSVNFSCQRCLQPLKLDSSLSNLGEHTIADLSLPITRNIEEDLELQSSSLNHFVPPFRYLDYGNGANGFLVISDDWDSNSFGYQLHVKAKLFDFLSNNSDVDHPLCDECTDSLLELMDIQLLQVEAECKDYSEYLTKLENDKEDLNLDLLEKELRDSNLEQARLMQELAALQKEEKALADSIDKQEVEKERLEADNDNYWREYNKYMKEIINIEDSEKYYESQITYMQCQLEKLKKTNIFKLVFYISDSDSIGVINNLRLGRSQNVQVDWCEINAAWGQTVLLLASLARKLNFEFVRYRLIPYGSHSYIQQVDDKKILPLYGSGGFKFFLDNKLDSAMVAFLDCLQQFKCQVERCDAGFCLPYKMDKGKIEEFSVKIQFNSEAQWSTALKYMLTNLKWALTWISSQFTDDDK